MNLGFDIAFEALYSREGLLSVDAAFRAELAASDAALAERLASGENTPDLLMAVAPHVEDFIGKLFGIPKDIQSLAEAHHDMASLYACKRLFVQRRAVKAYKAEEAVAFDGAALWRQLGFISELDFSRNVMKWLEDEAANEEKLTLAAKYAAWAVQHPPADTILFHIPQKLDFEHLVHPPAHLREREGFKLSDNGASLKKALDHANYCIFCHHQSKDSCSKGMREKDGAFKKNAFDITLAGCPLEEKISEMNELKAHGVPVGALAMAMVDNPMLAGTGHRICNDCMKSCIYQKQEPVDIPQIETRTLKDVLSLPYGYEIYSLLSRWNPLNIERPVPKAPTGRKVLVVGQGPAGYTLAHHLLNDGHEVVAIDGLKIEPVDRSLTPIEDIEQLREPLDTRIAKGFGGVAEYGITVRWDKNYLSLIRLLLERRSTYTLIGGVRFGGTLTIDQAWEMGFDHIALCMGAGKPTVLDIPNGMARGVRTASDFLMALQLTGAAREDSIANLQLRLPVIVIGGGLTAIDTATESLAYYPVQVEKFLMRYEALGEPPLWTGEEKEIAEEFIAHARAIRAAKAKGESVVALLRQWGGVKMVYRKRLMDAPSYRLNHEEVQKALEEGIEIVENIAPKAIEVDDYGHAKEVRFTDGVTMPARTVLVAAGTSPNTMLAQEDPKHIAVDGRYFRAVNESGQPVTPERSAKPNTPHVLLSIDKQGRAISFFGDLHPSFAGNVVKAMGSAKRGYPVISRLLARKVPSTQYPVPSELLQPYVVKVERLTPTIVEVVLHAPLQARNFEPGQFYKLQNFETLSTGYKVPGTEPLALTGAWVDKEKGLISVIVLEMGGSSNLCATLKAGEKVILMGPTGAPTHIPNGETVLLIGGGLGNAVLFSIGKAMKNAGCKVLYFAGYKKAEDRYKIEEIEAASEVVVWCCDEAADFAPNRANDRAFHGNMLEAILDYAKDATAPIKLSDVQHLIVIGSDRLMAAIAEARHGALKPYLNPKHEAIGSINSPMQCMMKEICGQCLQQHIDPETGAITYVYSCVNQDQKLGEVSFPHLASRLKQNNVQEKLTAAWLKKA